MRVLRRGKRGRALRGPRSRRSSAPLRPPRSCRPRRRLWHPPLERRRCKPCDRPPDRASPPFLDVAFRPPDRSSPPPDRASPPFLDVASRPPDRSSPPPDRASLDAACARSTDTCVSAARYRSVVLASLDAGRQSRSSTFAAPAPTAASPWRRAAASRRTARRSLAACPRIGTTRYRRASTWPCARSWGAIRGGAMSIRIHIARGCASSLCFPLFLFVVSRKSVVLALGNSQPDSNSGPPAPLGSAPAPRAPRVLPPLSALPLPPAPPGSLCSGSVSGTGGVAAQRGAAARWNASRKRSGAAAAAASSSCEPPSDQPQAACLPPQQERRRRLCGGASCSRRACATAAQPARPHAREGKGSPRTECSASCRAACYLLAMHRASASTAARTGAEGALSPPHMLPRLGPLFALVRRSAHQTANGSRRHGCEA